MTKYIHVQRTFEQVNHLCWVTASTSGTGKRKEAKNPPGSSNSGFPLQLSVGNLPTLSSDLGTHGAENPDSTDKEAGTG